LAVVEDAAHAVGTTYGGNAQAQVGDCRYSRMAVFSFHPVKTIAMGEGGAVTTNDSALRERLTRLRSHGMVRDPATFENRDLAFDADGHANPWYYEMPEPGYHYRATDIQCALGLSQLHKLDRFAERRRHLMARYRDLLAPLAPLVRLAPAPTDCVPAWHLCTLLIDFAAVGTSRAQVMAALRARGIGSQVHYIPVHLQPYYRRRYGELRLPGAESYYARCLSVPLFPGMADGDVDRVVDALATALRR
jgi:dTDP-4-amino-4,6-dideoxygalactose transaminase